MSITLHQLECFLAAAKTRHFSQGARSMRISPSALSEQIAKLEATLHRRLFDRAPRGVALTRSGEELIPMAESVLSAAATITEWGEGESHSSLTIGVAAASPRIRSIIALAAERLPHVRFHLRPVGFTGGLPALLRREVDCALVFELRSLAHSAGVHAIELWREKLVVIVSSAHRLANLEAANVEDLWGEVLLSASANEPGAPTRADEWYGMIDTSLLEKCTVSPSINGPDEAVELVAAGVGINIAGQSAVESYSRTGVAFVPLNTPLQATASLVVLDEPASPALARFVELADLATAVARRE